MLGELAICQSKAVGCQGSKYLALSLKADGTQSLRAEGIR